MENIKKVVLAYSGGLDTSVILTWLKKSYGAEIIAYAADVGQAEELKGLEEKAKKTGASKCYIYDLREEFVKDYVFPFIKSGIAYEKKYLLGTSIARPLIAKHQILLAKKLGADAVAHGATGKGNDQVRFELTFKSFMPDIKIIAPWRIWNFKSREDLINYAKENSIPIPVTKKKPYSSDRNLFHISYEGGILEDPWREPSEDMFILTKDPIKAPDKPTYITIGFKKGEPISINGKTYKPVELIEKLNTIGGKNGIGRVDIVENRLVGIKSRGVYETPGGTILIEAHNALEEITIDKEVQHYKDLVGLKYAELIYNGQWFSPLFSALTRFIDATQEYVTGEVRLKLYKGNCTVVGRRSEAPLYNPELATFGASWYNHKDAEGFINLFGLQQTIATIMRNKKKES